MLLRFPYNFAHWKAISSPTLPWAASGEVCIHKSLGKRTDYPAFNSNRVQPLGEVNQANQKKDSEQPMKHARGRAVLQGRLCMRLYKGLGNNFVRSVKVVTGARNHLYRT